MTNDVNEIKKQYADVICINCTHCKECSKDKIMINCYNNTKNVKCLSYELLPNLRTF